LWYNNDVDGKSISAASLLAGRSHIHSWRWKMGGDTETHCGFARFTFLFSTLKSDVKRAKYIHRLSRTKQISFSVSFPTDKS